MYFRFASLFLLANLLIGAMSEETLTRRETTEGANSNQALLGMVTKAMTSLTSLQQEMFSLKDKLYGLERADGALKGQIAQLTGDLKGQIAQVTGQTGALRGQMAEEASKQSAKVMEVQNKMNQIEQQTASSAAKDKEFLDKLDQLDKKVEKGSIVHAFSAMPSKDVPAWHRGNVVMDNVLYMHGYGYDSTTGKFTAPVRGLYAFHLTLTNLKGDMQTIVKMQVNDKWVGEVYTGVHEYGGTGHMEVLTELKVGEVVHISETYGQAVISKVFSKFSGFLIKAF